MSVLPDSRRSAGYRRYQSSFPLTENPVSEGLRWINGDSAAGLWRPVRTTPGFAFATGVSASPPYDDPTALLAGEWGRTQSVEALIVVPGSEPAQNQEVELRTLSSVRGNKLVGYEFLYSVRASIPYLQIMRWDGDPSDIAFFVSLAFSGGNQALVTGNRIKAISYPSGLHELYVDYGTGRVLGNPSNYTLKLSGTDSTYPTGAPGMGYFQHGGSAATLSDFGLSDFLVEAW